MYLLFQFIIVFIIFIAVSYFTWWFTNGHVPEFMDYKPWKCNLCLSYWLLTGIYVALGVSFELWVVLIAGVILAALNAIAMKVNQKNKTISINDFDKIKKI